MNGTYRFSQQSSWGEEPVYLITMSNATGSWPQPFPRKVKVSFPRRFRIRNETSYLTSKLRKIWDRVFRDYAIPSWQANLPHYHLTIRTHREDVVSVDWTGLEWTILLPKHFVRSYHFARACHWFATRGRHWIEDDSTPIAQALLELCDRHGHVLFEVPKPDSK